RPAARHKGGSEAEGNDECAVAGQRPAGDGDGGAAEQSGQQPEADPREQPEERNPAGEAPIVLGTPGCAFGHSGHGTEPTPRLPSPKPKCGWNLTDLKQRRVLPKIASQQGRQVNEPGASDQPIVVRLGRRSADAIGTQARRAPL